MESLMFSNNKCLDCGEELVEFNNQKMVIERENDRVSVFGMCGRRCTKCDYYELDEDSTHRYLKAKSSLAVDFKTTP
jgi:hypothetical protein